MKTGTKVLIGTLAWLGFVAMAGVSPASSSWTYVMLLFAAFVLVPLGLELVVERRDTGRIARSMNWATRAQLPAAAFLAISCGMVPGFWALLVAVPWAIVTALLASVGLGRMLRDTWSRPLDRLSADVGLGFLVIGGLWLLVDRGGLRPLGFDAEVVALTAVHFHFAGFVLPVLAGQICREMPDSRFAARGVVGVVLGVPAVAVGITTSQLGWSPGIEAATGAGLALGGATIAILHVRWAVDADDAALRDRILIGVCGVALFFAMVLAGAFAIRHFITPPAWLGLPGMRAFHGTLIAFGVGLCGFAGWRTATRRSS